MKTNTALSFALYFCFK